MPTAKFSQSRALPSANTAKATLGLLHDYDRLVRCQPLVGPVEKLPNAPEAIQQQVPESEQSSHHIWYQQTEHVPILPFGLLKKKVVFYNWFKDLANPTSISSSAPTSADSGVESRGGVESICYAPSNIKIYAVFRVEKKKRELRPDFRKGTIASRANGAVAAPMVGNAVNVNGSGDGMSAAAVQNGDDDDDDDDQGWKIVEETEMTCPNWLILQFSERQHKAAHEKMLDAIVHEAQKSAYVSVGDGV